MNITQMKRKMALALCVWMLGTSTVPAVWAEGAAQAASSEAQSVKAISLTNPVCAGGTIQLNVTGETGLSIRVAVLDSLNNEVQYQSVKSGATVLFEGLAAGTYSVTAAYSPAQENAKTAQLKDLVVSAAQPVAQPEQSVAQPEQPVTQPEQPVAQPEQPATQPEQPVTQPEVPLVEGIDVPQTDFGSQVEGGLENNGQQGAVVDGTLAQAAVLSGQSGLVEIITPVTPDGDGTGAPVTPDGDSTGTPVTPDGDGGVTPITPDGDGGVTPVTPDGGGGVTPITPDGDGEEQTATASQFQVTVTPGTDTLTISVTDGMTDNPVMIAVEGPNEYSVEHTIKNGSGEVVLTGLAAGEYSVMAGYLTLVSGVSDFKQNVTVGTSSGGEAEGGNQQEGNSDGNVTPIVPGGSGEDGTSGAQAFQVSVTPGTDTLTVSVAQGEVGELIVLSVDGPSGNIGTWNTDTGSREETLTGLPAGEYIVQAYYFDDPNGASAFRQSVTLSATPGEADDSGNTTPTTASQFHVGLYPDAGRLEVDVWGGSDLEITAVVTKPDGTSETRTITGGGGIVAFENLAGGTYQVSVNYTTPVLGVEAYSASVDVPAPGTTPPPEEGGSYRQIEAIASVSGSTIAVTLLDAYDRDEILATLSDGTQKKVENGQVQFTDLKAGTYAVILSYKNNPDQFTKSITGLVVEEAPSASQIVATAVAGQRQIEVNVTSASALPVAVTLMQGGAVKDTRSIAAGVGSVRFENLPAGTYSVSVDYAPSQPGVPAVVVDNLVVTQAPVGIAITQVVAGENQLVVTGTAQPNTDITLTTQPASSTVIVHSDANGMFAGSIVCGAGTYTAVYAQYGSDAASRVTYGGNFVVTAPAAKPTLMVDPVSSKAATVVAKTTPGVVVNLATYDFGQTRTADSRGILRFSLPHNYGLGTVLTFTVYYGTNNVNSFTQTVTVTGTIHYNLLKKGMVGEDVYNLTARLNQLGYPVSPTRTYNDTVVAAVRLFQQNNGLAVDGMAGELTQSALYSVCAIAYDEGTVVYPTFVRGDKGYALLYTMQQRLKDLGYYTIKVDGIFGSGTQRAVRWFQQVNGLSVTGVADNATQQLLYSSAAKPASGYPGDDQYVTLSRSSQYNAAVVPLQRRLKSLGYLSGSVDGYFGSQTYRAVRNFQSRNGLSVTGVADPYTQEVLYSSSARPASSGGSSSGSTSGYTLLTWGSKGAAVKRLQQTLLNLGYTQVRSADGIYGQWTYDAVCAFQKNMGLSVDGIAGVKTQTALYGPNPALASKTQASNLSVTAIATATPAPTATPQPVTLGDLRVDFYNVGKADSMLITTAQGAHILIDTATDDDGETLVKSLQDAGVTRLDLMIITHFDKDHVGGADKILKAMPVDQVIMPRYEKDSNQYKEFTDALEQNPTTRVTVLEAKQTLEFTWSDMTLKISAANETDYGDDEENDFSLVARMTYGDTRFLFTGDAESARQTELLLEGDLACDVLKVPYHGRLVDVSAAFLTACSPKIAFITDSTEEPADTLVVEQLKALGAQVYCAKDGGIAVVSNGSDVRVVQ